mgnify:CR=1 FL=1
MNVRADKDGLERVFQNLLQNVCRYAGRELSVRLDREGGRAVISFTNDAEGMSEETAGRLFERFYTADSSRNQGSTGWDSPSPMSDRENGRYADGCKRRKYLKFILTL